MYERFAFFLPRSIIEDFGKQLRFNGNPARPEKFVGMIIFYSFFFAVILALVANFVFAFSPLITFALGLIAPGFLVWILLKLSSESKGKFVETILPDALQLIASNMKSGLTTERAIFVAARPEFGVLQKELLNASKLISAGETVEVALKKAGEAINSVVLEKSIWLITQGIKSGAQMADLLFQLSDDLKNEQSIKEEIAANISIYIILIVFAAALGAPILFGVSTFIVQVLTKQLNSAQSLDLSTGASAGNLGSAGALVGGERKQIDPGFVIDFAVLMLIVSSFFASLTMGVINSGKELTGIKYILPVTIVALVMFFVTRIVMIGAFSNLI